jgi:hypothetical protein
MTDRLPILSDALIEAALARRAPGHADAGLLRSIVSRAEAMPQVPAWRSRLLPVPPRARVWVAIAAAAVLGAGLLLAGVGRQPRPSVVSTPTSAPSANPSSAPAGACATDNARVAIGGDMPPQVAQPMAIGAGIVDRGAYITHPINGAAVPAEVWSVGAGSSKRIATVDGPDIMVVSIDDVSRDGGLVLLAIGHITGGDALPECIDLYLLSSDGSSVTRLTNYSSGEKAMGGQISADNRYVAFDHDFTFQSSPRSGYVIFDRLATQDASREFVCSLDSWSANLAWEPDNQGLAAVCAPQLIVADQTGTSADLPFAADQLVGLDWQSSAGLVVAAASAGTPTNTIDVWTLKFGSALSFPGFAAPKRVPVPFDVLTCCVGPISGAAGLVSPDGRYLLVPGEPKGSTTGDTLWYAVRLSDGSSTQIVPARGIEPSWSADSRTIVYVRWSDTGETASLVVHDLATGDESIVRPLPAGFAQGVWHRG